MEKYKAYSVIKKRDIQRFNGLQNELITHFHNPKGQALPVFVTCFGITFPTPDYYIKRQRVGGYILEHVLEGKGYVIVNGNKYTVEAGDTYLLKSDESVEYFSDTKNPYKKMWINFQGPLPTQCISIYKLRDTVYKNVDLTELFEQLYQLDEISTDVSEIHYEFANIIVQMILKLAKSVENNTFVPKNVNHIRLTLNASIYKSFNLDELCKTLFLSKSEIIRIFKNSYGVTPYQYLLDLKISTAKTILENGTASIKEIADKFCFSSPYHFSELFKQKVGVSPLKYRKQSREK